MKKPILDINFLKVAVGVAFSLLWAHVMYRIWEQPSFLTFLWFYLLIGSIILKWVLFKAIDWVFLKLKIKSVRKELDESATRVGAAVKNYPKDKKSQVQPDTTTRLSFEEHYQRIKQDVLALGAMVEKGLTNSITSLQNRDPELAGKIINNDHTLDMQELNIKNDCMRLLAGDHPEGIDLRNIVAILAIITELERMGDYAEGIAKITIMIGDQPPIKPLIDIPRMAELAVIMLNGSLEAFFERNTTKAEFIFQTDDEIDALYDQVFREVLLLMIQDPKNIAQGTRSIWVAHDLERFADRATNICEQVVFSVTGKTAEIAKRSSKTPGTVI